jgi:hypothetical protein
MTDMHLSLKPDFDTCFARYEAFWNRAVLDRPPVDIRIPRECAGPVPSKEYASADEKWTDVDFRAGQQAAWLEAQEFLGDALPIAWPNLGPEIYSAWCGCAYHFTEDTGWSEPCVSDWDRDIEKVRLDMSHPFFRLCERYTSNLLELGKGRFLTGLTDFHSGGDHLAALRDPQRLALDMVENVEHVKAELVRSQVEYFTAYDHFYDMLKKGGSLACSWMESLLSGGRFYIPSNDFSCMVSKAMFDDVFLPGIAAECRFFDRSIYHLDGPGALRHLDSILEIRELDAVQWVCGAGNEGFTRWAHVYRKIQNAGKGIVIYPELEELPAVFEALRPEGVYFARVGGVGDRETAEEALKRIEKWE